MHNNSPINIPLITQSPMELTKREKLEGGQSFVLETSFDAAGDQPAQGAHRGAQRQHGAAAAGGAPVSR